VGANFSRPGIQLSKPFMTAPGDGRAAVGHLHPSDRIMIWNSIPLMTALDLLIIAVTIYAMGAAN
jgi:hypothetical protein